MTTFVDDDQVRPGALEAVDRAFAAVRGAVVDDQEDALRLLVGVLGHELVDEGVEGLDAVLGSAAVEDLGVAGVPGGQVAERAHALVLVLDLQALAGRGGERGGEPLARLDGGLLVGADDVVAGVQAFAVPVTGVEVEDRPGALGEQWVAREDPRAMLPRLDCVLRQPAPDRSRH